VLEGRLRPIVEPQHQEDSVLAVELWNHAVLFGGSWEFAHPVYICFVDLEKEVLLSMGTRTIVTSHLVLV